MYWPGGHAAAAALLVGPLPPPAGAQQRGRLGPRPPGYRGHLITVPSCPVCVQVNVLAANTHSSAGWSSGSGLYSPSGHRAYTHNLQPGAGGSLLLADMDISPAKVGPHCNSVAFCCNCICIVMIISSGVSTGLGTRPLWWTRCRPQAACSRRQCTAEHTNRDKMMD